MSVRSVTSSLWLAGLLALALAACKQPPPSRPGMVYVPAGEFWRGRDRAPHPDQTPRHRVRLDAFFLDETLVTVADFRRFVERTGHVTSAERLGFGMSATEGLEDWEWKRVKGASWRQPFGPERAAELPVHDDEPVTTVSWSDATAYCAYLGKRLPTEAEWEYAMRAGSSGTRFPWGDKETLPDGGYGINFWQGQDHSKDELRDGYRYLSPVRAYPPNAWGLYDPAGNVWQWTADWYSADTYRLAAEQGGVTNPQGPRSGDRRVARGGSWWCSRGTCSAYGLHARGKSKPEAPFNNNGFRCAASP